MSIRWTLTTQGWRSGDSLVPLTPPPGFVPEYPGQPDPAIVPLWGEGIRVASGTIRPDSAHVRLFGVPGDFGVGGEIATDLATCRAYGSVPHVSTKVPNTDWTAVANGTEDAFFTDPTTGVFARLQEHIDAGGLPGLFSVHHEPDGAGGDTQPGGSDGTAAQHLAMNERVRTLMDANLTGWSLGPTFTGWMFRHSNLGTARDPRDWVPVSNPYQWIGSDLYSGVDGSVLEYGGSGVDINGVVRQGNPDRFLAFCRERGLDGYVPEWGVEASADDDLDVRAFYDWLLANDDTIKGVIYYNRSLEVDAEWQFYKNDRWPDPRAAEWIEIFNQRNRAGRATHVAYPPLDGMFVAGSSQTNNGAVTKFEGPGALEQLPVRRRFYTDFTAGSGSMIAAAVEDVAAGRVPWVSSKFPDWQTAGNGGYDGPLDTMLSGLGAIDGPVILSMNHEPEGGGGSNFPDQYANDANAPTYWCNAQQRVRERMTALGVTNVCFAPILMGYTFKDASRPNGTYPTATTAQAGWHRNPNLWWRDVDSNGDRIFDAYGIDWYVESGAVDGSVWQDNTFAEYGAIREFVENKGVDLMIGEWGSRDSVDTDTSGASQWARIDSFLTHLAGTHSDGNGARVTVAVYYDSTIAEDWHLRPVAEANYITYLQTDSAVARLPDLLLE